MQFQDNVDSGVFWRMTKREMEEYKSSVNYITMVEA